jgi:hypothetical protein
MRIQETDKILKDSRVLRHGNHHQNEHSGMLARVWRKITSVFRHG